MNYQWIKTSIGEIADIKHGWAFPGSGISEEVSDNVLVTPGSFKIGGGFKKDNKKFFNGDYPHEYLLHPDDLIVTMTDLSKNTDTLGFSALVPDDGKKYLHNQRIGLVQLKSNVIDKKYLYWLLRTYHYQRFIAGSASGTTVKHTSPTLIKKYCFLMPPLEKQKKIVGVLSSLDNKIELNAQINHNLEEQAKAIFKSWFVDFEPFQNGKFVDSELGKIPEGWRVEVLNEIADITMGQSPQGASYNEDAVGTVFYQGRAEFTDRFPARRLFTTEPKRMANAGDVLLSIRAPVGDLNIANEPCCIGRGLAAIHAKNGFASFIFYTMLALKPELEKYNGEGTVFGCINKDSLSSQKVIIPPRNIIANFESVVSPLDYLYLEYIPK